MNWTPEEAGNIVPAIEESVDKLIPDQDCPLSRDLLRFYFAIGPQLGTMTDEEVRDWILRYTGE